MEKPMDMDEMRKTIDSIDDEMLELFLKRMHICEDIAEYKKARGLAIEQKSRERAVLARVAEKSGDMELYSNRFFNALMEISKARQASLASGGTRVGALIREGLDAGGMTLPRSGSVACQGVEGANSQAACDRFFPRGSIVYVKTFEAVFDAVESGLCRFGVLPIENSSTGSVRAVYDLLQKKHFSIISSTKLNVHHVLLARKGAKLSDIRTILSHEQALSQCSDFISSLSGVSASPCANTALAAKLVAESSDPTLAAISSESCAPLYGLEVIRDNIQNTDNNYTRFICIEKSPRIYEGANRISIIVSCENRPGALYELLSKPYAIGVNMSKLESCPVTGRDFEFIFFIELDASVRENEVVPMLEAMERCSKQLTFLGNYAEV